MTRRPILAAAIVLAAFATPAFAAEADIALLQKYAGTWLGSGKLTGAEEGNLACRMTMKPSGSKLYYNGRCALDGQGSDSFQGAIQYNDDLNRYEARSSGSPPVVGTRSGGGIVFSFAETDRRGSVNSTMSLTGGTIKLSFRIVDAKTREVTRSNISFKKS